MSVPINVLVQIPCVIGTAGLWTQGGKHRIAPALGFLSEVAWLGWAVVADVPGMYPWSVLWGLIYARTWWAWGKA